MPKLVRIERNSAGELLSEEWKNSAGALVDPGTVTIGIVRADGTTLVAAGTATSGSGAAARTYTPSLANTALLDRWIVTFTSSVYGAKTPQYVEVSGGFLFSMASLIAVKPQNLTWTAAQMTEMRTTVETAIEDEYGTALVPRYELKALGNDGNPAIELRDPVRAVRSITVNGTALSAGELAGLYFNYGRVTGYPWPTGNGNIVVGYEYGLDYPPPRMSMDAVRLARQWLVNGPIDDRALGAASPDGGFSFGLATPGRNGSIFGLPDLDAAIQASPFRVGVA